MQEFVCLALSSTLVSPKATSLRSQERALDCIRLSLAAWGPAAVAGFGLLFQDVELILSKACGEIESTFKSLVGPSLEEFHRNMLVVLRLLFTDLR